MIYFDFMHGKNHLSAWAPYLVVSGMTGHLKKQTGTPFEIDPFFSKHSKWTLYDESEENDSGKSLHIK